MENTFFGEHILWRTHSIENTFYGEHILWGTHSMENTFYGVMYCHVHMYTYKATHPHV